MAGIKKKTMHDLYGDGSKHEACIVCGFCKTCGDCKQFGCGANRQRQTKR